MQYEECWIFTLERNAQVEEKIQAIGSKDAIDNNGARKGEETPIFSWVKREELITYEGIDTQVEGNRRSSLCENWTAVTQMGSVEILHESLQVDGAVAKSVVTTKTDEVRVEIMKTWAKRIQEEWKSLEEDLPPPKPPDLN
ncbi:hypothetical protein LR48_Vigan102s003400 [Vigna angularis]|uniref:Uncharacterized protein n=1 Tax=Phaseolus angularis TaxID=3914 RepID=A0A0L9T4U8_PHAAN|nr:hypothetical protein LR48_Vigan102s003400 [Vigna angularis]